MRLAPGRATTGLGAPAQIVGPPLRLAQASDFVIAVHDPPHDRTHNVLARLVAAGKHGAEHVIGVLPFPMVSRRHGRYLLQGTSATSGASEAILQATLLGRDLHPK